MHDEQPTVPYGHCHCGCGERTKIAGWTDRAGGYVKGQPRRFLKGHTGRTPGVPLRGYVVEDRGHDTPCWIWALSGVRYGSVKRNGKSIGAHCNAWIEAQGPIPDGLYVLHRCDQPPCVNPDHLFLGTALDNMQDRAAKGRAPVGARHPNAKVTWEQVDEMRRLAAAGASRRTLGKAFGISDVAAGNIIYGRTWREETRPCD